MRNNWEITEEIPLSGHRSSLRLRMLEYFYAKCTPAIASSAINMIAFFGLKAIEAMQLGKSLVSGAIIGVGLWFFGDAPILSVLVISVGVFLLLSRWRFTKQLRTFPRDFR